MNGPQRTAYFAKRMHNYTYIQSAVMGSISLAMSDLTFCVLGIINPILLLADYPR